MPTPSAFLGRAAAVKTGGEDVLMARRVIHELVDDIDGKPADENVAFALDGVHYTIDLSAANAKNLRGALEPFIAAGQKISRGGIVPSSRGGRGAAPVSAGRGDRDRNRAIREWAQGEGLDVSERGRIKQDIIDRYQSQTRR